MNISIINNGDSGLTARTIINQVITALNTANVTASFVTSSNIYGPYGSNSILSASYALTSSFLTPGTYIVTSSWAQSSSQALTASFLPVNTYNITASWAQSSSQALTASFLPVGTYSVTSSWAQSSSQALTASYTPNALTTASVSLNTITFTRGNGSTFNLTVNTGSQLLPAGTSGQIQFNSGTSTFASDSNLTYDTTNDVLNTAGLNAGKISFSGPLIYSGIQVIEESYNVKNTDSILLVASSIGEFTLNLSDTYSNGTVITIKDADGSANSNPITIQGTIDGNPLYTIARSYECVQLVYSETRGYWFNLSK